MVEALKERRHFDDITDCVDGYEEPEALKVVLEMPLTPAPVRNPHQESYESWGAGMAQGETCRNWDDGINNPSTHPDKYEELAHLHDSQSRFTSGGGGWGNQKADAEEGR
jgi:hypothetical protein